MLANTSAEDKEREERLKQLMRQRDREALLEILSTPLTRWFLMRLFDKTGVFSKSFTGNSETFFREGKRDIGRQYLEEIEKLEMQGLELKHMAEKEYAEKKKEFYFKRNEEQE